MGSNQNYSLQFLTRFNSRNEYSWVGDCGQKFLTSFFEWFLKRNVERSMF